MEIQEIIRKLSGVNQFNNTTLYEAIVTGVDLSERTIQCTTNGGIEVDDMSISMMTTIGDGSYLIPRIGSTIYIMINPMINPFVIQYGETESVVLTATDKITMNSNEFGGLIKIQELTDKINNLENALNNLITLYNAHIHPVAGASTGPTVSTDTDIITITTTTDIENPDIVHGSKLT